MKVLAFIAFVSLAQGALLGSKKCTYGPSYWCSHVDHARECSAMQHCISTVWKNHPQGMIGDTEGCFDVIETLDDVRRAGIPHNMLQKISASCTAMMGEKKSVCKELMMKNQNEVLLLLQSDLLSKNVAKALGLCGGFPDTVPHPQSGSEEVVQVTGDICTDCLNFFGDLQEIFNKSEERCAQMLKDKICARLGYFENLCNETVDTYTSFVLNFFTQQLNPQDLCYLLRFCGNATHDFGKTLLSLAAKAKFSSVECGVCQHFAKDLQNILRNTTLQSEILSVLENEVCPLMPGDLAAQCKTYVSMYGPLAFTVLIDELDPNTICQKLGFCNSTGVQTLVVVPLGEQATRVRLQGHQPQSQEHFSPECLFCEEIVKKLIDYGITNATEAEIVALLEKICSLMPEADKAKCDAFVEKYGPLVASFLQKMAPNAVCTALHLCIVEQPVQVASHMPVKSAETCLVCETVVTSIRDYLNNPDHQKTIEQFMDQVCSLLPASYQQLCLELINTYEPALINLLNQYDDPLKVCTALNLCSSRKVDGNESGHPLTFVPMEKLQPAMPHLLCLQSPEVFCASLETARHCNAVEYCMEKYNLKVDG